jgi:hypothetical protein
MPSAREVLSGLFGAWRLAHLDRTGMVYFDQSVQGFWNSFFAAALVAPGYLILVLLHLSQVPPAAGAPRIFLVESIAYVMSWTAFPLAVFFITEMIGKEREYIGYIVAANWANVIQLMIYLPVTVIAATIVLPAQLAVFLNVAVSLLILAYHWFVTRTALGVNPFAAAGFVLLDVTIGVMIKGVADSMIY